MLSMARSAAASFWDPTIDRRPLPHAPPVLQHEQDVISTRH